MTIENTKIVCNVLKIAYSGVQSLKDWYILFVVSLESHSKKEKMNKLVNTKTIIFHLLDFLLFVAFVFEYTAHSYVITGCQCQVNIIISPPLDHVMQSSHRKHPALQI